MLRLCSPSSKKALHFTHTPVICIPCWIIILLWFLFGLKVSLLAQLHVKCRKLIGASYITCLRKGGFPGWATSMRCLLSPATAGERKDHSSHHMPAPARLPQRARWPWLHCLLFNTTALAKALAACQRDCLGPELFNTLPHDVAKGGSGRFMAFVEETNSEARSREDNEVKWISAKWDWEKSSL